VPETPAAAPEPAKPAGKEQHPVGQATVDEKPETPAQVAAGRIPLAAKVVVEFGCGRGEVGTEFLRRQPAARYYGVTLRHADAVAAAHVLTGALCGTPETADLGLLGLTDVDCIAFSPEAAELVSAECLRRHAEVLAADGQMVFARKGKMDELIALLRTAGFVQFFADRQGAYTVLRAVRQAMPTMSLQTLMGETIVTAFTRVLHPNTCLSAVPGFFVRQSATSLSKALAKQVQTSIVIRQRRSFASFEEAWQRTQMLRKEGFLVVSEIDDNPVLWQAKHEATRFLDFAGAHAVQTSTPALAEVLRQYNPHVFVFPNQLWELPEQRDYAAEAQEHGERVNIFFGALNREEDWQDIVPVLNRAAEKYGDKVFFRVLADRAFYDALATDAKEFVAERGIYGGKFVPYDVYARTLHASDISLLPLHDTEFNRTKSDLKFIESAGHGAVVLASPTVYEHTVVDGCTGCIYHDADEFEAKLAHLIEDAPYRHAIADAAYGYVRAHRMMSQHYMERVRAYRWLAEHKDELDEELAARLAKIRNQG
jgi:glycosyltransferase involved in cell wall biosynthesis